MNDMRYTQRPYKHVVSEVTPMGGIRMIVLGTYSTLARAIAAAQRADATCPNETREIRLRNWTYRNRYAHGPVATWKAD